jgi:hypothetical protein
MPKIHITTEQMIDMCKSNKTIETTIDYNVGEKTWTYRITMSPELINID